MIDAERCAFEILGQLVANEIEILVEARCQDVFPPHEIVMADVLFAQPLQRGLAFRN